MNRAARQYVDSVIALSANRKLFAGKEIVIAPGELERLLGLAFEAGEESGRNEKSYFQQIFG